METSAILKVAFGEQMMGKTLKNCGFTFEDCEHPGHLLTSKT
jgi:hypothetical protein